MGRLIDIDRLCDDLMERWSIADKKKEDTIRAVMADVVTPIVVSQPTVDAVPVRHGRWKAVKDGEDDYRRICSCCGEDAPYDESDDCYLIYPHCPWCGAKMDGDGND